MRKFYYLLIAIFLIPVECFSQEHDSTFYISNKKLLSIGILQSQRAYKIAIRPIKTLNNNETSAIAYQADARVATGFVLDYRKISLAIAFRTGGTDIHKKGETKYRNIVLGFGNNKYLMEAGYRTYKGFYDVNSGNYIPGYTDDTPYYINPSIGAELFKAKFFYFTNHKKFAYKAAYSCGYKQIKSAFSWIVSGVSNYEKITSDSGIIPSYLRVNYIDENYFNELSTRNFGFGAGASGTIVFLQDFYLNLTILPYLQTQFRNYGFENIPSKSKTYLGASGDLRGSLGFSGNKIFVFLSSISEVDAMNGENLKIETSFTSLTLTLGYRFNVEKTSMAKKLDERFKKK